MLHVTNSLFFPKQNSNSRLFRRSTCSRNTTPAASVGPARVESTSLRTALAGPTGWRSNSWPSILPCWSRPGTVDDLFFSSTSGSTFSRAFLSSTPHARVSVPAHTWTGSALERAIACDSVRQRVTVADVPHRDSFRHGEETGLASCDTCGLPRACAHRTLIGACNSILCPMRVCRGPQPPPPPAPGGTTPAGMAAIGVHGNFDIMCNVAQSPWGLRDGVCRGKGVVIP